MNAVTRKVAMKKVYVYDKKLKCVVEKPRKVPLFTPCSMQQHFEAGRKAFYKSLLKGR